MTQVSQSVAREYNDKRCEGFGREEPENEFALLPKNTKEKILVVDDDQAIRWTLAEALRSWSFTPLQAGTVAEALTQFNGELPAAVLLDIDLPDGSGLDVLRQIKNERPDTVVIMITGNVQIDKTISALRGGAYDFIGKPKFQVPWPW